MNNPVSDIEKLRFYRNEIRHEFDLLAARSTMLVTVQSFLVVPFALLQTAANFFGVLPYTFIVAVLGILVALVLYRPLHATHSTINKWLIKQRQLFAASPELKDLALDRDLIPGAERNIRKDRVHMQSIAFSRVGPWAFIAFWLALVAWSGLRILLGMY